MVPGTVNVYLPAVRTLETDARLFAPLHVWAEPPWQLLSSILRKLQSAQFLASVQVAPCTTLVHQGVVGVFGRHRRMNGCERRARKMQPAQRRWPPSPRSVAGQGGQDKPLAPRSRQCPVTPEGAPHPSGRGPGGRQRVGNVGCNLELAGVPPLDVLLLFPRNLPAQSQAARPLLGVMPSIPEPGLPAKLKPVVQHFPFGAWGQCARLSKIPSPGHGLKGTSSCSSKGEPSRSAQRNRAHHQAACDPFYPRRAGEQRQRAGCVVVAVSVQPPATMPGESSVMSGTALANLSPLPPGRSYGRFLRLNKHGLGATPGLVSPRMNIPGTPLQARALPRKTQGLETPTSWECHQGTISDPDEVPMGLGTTVFAWEDHFWCPGGSGQAGHIPCLCIFFIPTAAGRWEGGRGTPLP
eukprot:gene14544-biopygen5121